VTADACFECENRKVTLFYLHVEALVVGDYVPFGDFAAGGMTQVACPYCSEDDYLRFSWRK